MKISILIFLLNFQNVIHAAEVVDIANAEAVVETKVKNGKIEFSVLPTKGTHLNFDGPWQLTVEGAVPVSDEKFKSLKSDDFDKTKNQFLIPLQAKADTKKIDGQYKLVYFLCGDDNKWCKRNQKSGTLKF